MTKTGVKKVKRVQSLGEEIANAVSHGVGAIFAIAGSAFIITYAALNSAPIGIVSVSLYSACLILLYVSSCLYHSFTGRVKKLFRIFDHCSIFILILGTYIPASLLLVGGARGWVLFGINAAVATVGIVFNAIDLERWRKYSVILYVVMGWSVMAIGTDVLCTVPTDGLMLLVQGGLAYTVGIIFYALKKPKYLHFVWHLFVLSGSILHYFFVLYYCL